MYAKIVCNLLTIILNTIITKGKFANARSTERSCTIDSIKYMVIYNRKGNVKKTKNSITRQAWYNTHKIWIIYKFMQNHTRGWVI